MKVSKSQNVRIRKSQTWKVSEFEYEKIRISGALQLFQQRGSQNSNISRVCKFRYFFDMGLTFWTEEKLLFFVFFLAPTWSSPCLNGGPPEISLSGTTSSAPWAGATVATVMPQLLHCPIATPGSPRGNNQCSMAESIQAAHAVTGIQTHHPLIREIVCLHTATTSTRPNEKH